ncbi:MAG: hypothetical protein M3Y86_11525 [Verrucomicrobiota bacterium]|nr:hypothetical protein [Verrucomicrobiota bacterium]
MNLHYLIILIALFLAVGAILIATYSLRLFFAAFALFLLSLLVSCTMDTSKSAADNAATFINSPGTQAELQTLDQIATNALNAWLNSSLTKGRHMTRAEFISEQAAAAAAQHPELKKAAIRAAISRKLNG